MERIVEQGLLYDFYGELLTGHQRQVYEDYVLNDLSASEIAQERGVSRQGIHEIVKRCDRLLEEYEQKLHLVEKFLQTRKYISEIYELARQGSENGSRETLEQIEGIAREILDNL